MSATTPARWLPLSTGGHRVAGGEIIRGEGAAVDTLAALVQDAQLVHSTRQRVLYAESHATALLTTTSAAYVTLWQDIPIRPSRDCSTSWRVTIAGTNATASVTLWDTLGGVGVGTVLAPSITGGPGTATATSGAGAYSSDTTYYLQVRLKTQSGAGTATITDIWIEEVDA